METDSCALNVRVASAPLEELDADLLAVPVFEEDGPDDRLDRATNGDVARAFRAGEFKAKPFSTFLTGVSWKAPRVLVVGLGPRAEWCADRLRKAAATAALFAREHRVGRLAFVVPAPLADRAATDALVQAAAEGMSLSQLNLAVYRTLEPDPAFPETLTVSLPWVDDLAGAANAASRGSVLGRATNLARSLANEPGNLLRPAAFAERGAAVAAAAGLRVEVLDERRLGELGMGLLLGVAQGSQESPRLLVMEHVPEGAPSSPVLGLVGKGITFDSGGISIKPSLGMDRMKDDMAGGAAVIAAMTAIAGLRAPIRVIGVVPMAENMPSGNAIRPGDVLRSASGKTVEVIDTDAEGRLVLGDALWYVQQLGATHLVDIATLTGACMVALGKTTSGLFGTPPGWVEHVRAVAERAGDRVWPLPLFPEYREQLRSEIADILNTGGRPAGAITAAVFLQEFVERRPWAHLDIAGTAWSDDARPYMPKGPTGTGVRTLAELPFTHLP